MTKVSVYDKITNQIIELLEKGIVPWRKPWKVEGGRGGMPRNAISGKEYRGCNIFMLAMNDFKSCEWLTYKQAQSLGGQVKKGEKGTEVVFWKMLDLKAVEVEEKGRRIPLLKSYYVFNVEQCEGLKVVPVIEEELEGARVFQPIEICEEKVKSFPKIEVNHHGNSACYSPLFDIVTMPMKESFGKAEEYYHTLFHEMTHATGHQSRLNREGIAAVSNFGSESYSKEELIAEMGACFLSAQCGIEPVVIDNSASYIGNWLMKLRKDNKLVVQAAGQAQRAVDFLVGKKFEVEVEV